MKAKGISKAHGRRDGKGVDTNTCRPRIINWYLGRSGQRMGWTSYTGSDAREWYGERGPSWNSRGSVDVSAHLQLLGIR